MNNMETPAAWTTMRAEFLSFGSATVYEAMGQSGALPSRIKPLRRSMKICGRAFTIKGHPRDNLALHRAIAEAAEGSILVADVDGCTEAGHWGEIMTVAAMQRNIGGVIINGGVRDSQVTAELGFPVFCVNVCIQGTAKKHSGLLNVPVELDGCRVNPGDLVLGDEDGVVCVPWQQLDHAFAASQERMEKEALVKDQLKTRTTLDIYGF